MALELVMADVAGRRLRALPAEVDLTFTYPLRDSIEQVQSFQQTLRRVLDGGGRSLGTVFRPADDIGIYNESSAAKGGTRVFGEVCLVGDLGGGTLDLFISAEGGPGIDFEEVADSAKLGGNELLRTMAEHPDRFLPPGWAGRSEDARDPVARLDALQGVAAVPWRRRRARAPCRSRGDGFRQACGIEGRARTDRTLLPVDRGVHGAQPRGLSRPPLVCPDPGATARRPR